MVYFSGSTFNSAISKISPEATEKRVTKTNHIFHWFWAENLEISKVPVSASAFIGLSERRRHLVAVPGPSNRAVLSLA